MERSGVWRCRRASAHLSTPRPLARRIRFPAEQNSVRSRRTHSRAHWRAFSALGTGLASRSTGMSRKCACVTFARVVRHKRPPRGSTLHSPAVSCSRKRTFCGGFVCFAEIFEAMCPVDHMHDSGELFTTLLDLSPDCGVSVRCFLVLRGEWLEETNRSTFGRAIRRIGEVRVKSLRKST